MALHTDCDKLSSSFNASDRRCVVIPELLERGIAAAIRETLITSADWGLTFCAGERMQGLAPREYGSLGPGQTAAIAKRCYEKASDGFAFIREALWNAEAASFASRPDLPNSPMHSFLDDEFLVFCSAVLGVPRVQLVDCACIRYAPGHFYSFTEGAPAAAEFGFIYDLSQLWHLEWGGLFELMSFTGGVERALAPRFNSLVLFSLFAHHAVSFVTPFGRNRRVMISGKLRAD